MKHAVVFGASGVSGWAFVNELVHDYPDEGVWSRVTAFTNRPLAVGASLWPADGRLALVPGVDLLAGSQDDLEALIRERVHDIDTATHVYYLAYKANPDPEQEYNDAVNMFRRSTTAMDHLSPELEFVVLQTGAKMYGVHHLGKPGATLTPPMTETMDRVQPPYDYIFYYPQIDWITQYARGKKWTWCETRPDIVVGFVPGNNYYSLASALGIYLALYADVAGQGAECPFPGTAKSWVAKSNDSSADIIARQTIYFSLHPDTCGMGRAFNVADAAQWQTWSAKWPQLCVYFGLKGTPPPEENPPEVRDYILTHMAHWQDMERRHGLRTGIASSAHRHEGFEYFLLATFDFDRQYDMARVKEVGFAEERTTMQAWGGAFDRMRQAKIIP